MTGLVWEDVVEIDFRKLNLSVAFVVQHFLYTFRTFLRAVSTFAHFLRCYRHVRSDICGIAHA